MSGLRVEKRDIYRIEVNDDGDYIEFDLADVNLGFRCREALEMIDEIQKETIVKEKEILELKEDDNTNSYISLKQKGLIDLEQETFLKMRKAMDRFLGEGACQKIFGDRNYYEMFDDLLEEFIKPRNELGGKSHFDKLQITSDGIRKRIIDKYNKNKKSVI